MGFAGRLLLELGQQLFLALGEFLRGLHHHLDVHVAGMPFAQNRHAAARNPKAAARLGAFRDLHAGLAALDGRHVEATAERGRHHGDRHAAMQVRAVALEERVRGERQEDVKIAGRPAAPARFALAGEPDTRAIFDTARDVDREHALAGQAAGARAGWTRVVDHLATAVTRRAGALEREETLGLANLAVARAARAGLRFRSGLGAAARASLAGHRGRNADLRG